MFCRALFLGSGVFFGGGGVAEQQGDAPNSGQTDQCINHAADGAVGATESKGHQVETEDADGAPVQAANDGQNQGNLIKYHARFLLILVTGIVYVGVIKIIQKVRVNYGRSKYFRRQMSVSGPGVMVCDSMI